MSHKMPADTTFGKTIPLGRILPSLTTLTSNLYGTTNLNGLEGCQGYLITGEEFYAQDVPPFAHPIFLHNGRSDFVCGDVRPYVKLNGGETGGYVVKNEAEYMLCKKRVDLNVFWVNYGQEKHDMRQRTTLATGVFCNVMQSLLRSKYMLDAKECVYLRAVALHYYYCLFLDKEELNVQDISVLCNLSAKIIRTERDALETLFGNLPFANTMEGFIKNIQDYVGNIRLRDFSVAALLTVTSNLWYAVNGRDITAIALEHPPTWIAMVFSALTDRSFKKTILAQIVSDTGDNTTTTSFIAYVDSLSSRSISIESLLPSLAEILQKKMSMV